MVNHRNWLDDSPPLIDESKMTVGSPFSFLNCRKQHTNLKSRLLFKIKKTNQLSLSKTAPLTLTTKRPYMPTTDTQLGWTAYETNV